MIFTAAGDWRSVARAFLRSSPMESENHRTDGRTLFVYDNPVATWVNGPNELRISDCGWQTKLTMSVLNEVIRPLGLRIVRRDKCWFLVEDDYGDAFLWQGDHDIMGRRLVNPCPVSMDDFSKKYRAVRKRIRNRLKPFVIGVLDGSEKAPTGIPELDSMLEEYGHDVVAFLCEEMEGQGLHDVSAIMKDRKTAEKGWSDLERHAMGIIMAKIQVRMRDEVLAEYEEREGRRWARRSPTGRVGCRTPR